MKTSKPIQAEIVEFKCEECNQGVYRVDNSMDPLPNRWGHKCTNCGQQGYSPFTYPYIEYKNEQFVLEKHIVKVNPTPDLLR